MAVLHTWTRTLEYHPHAHLLVTAGGLAPDGARWQKPRHRRFLVPGYMLSPMFRARMRDALEHHGLLADVVPRAWTRRWTVHVQQIGTGAHAARYLARYVFHVALTNDRLVRLANDRVTFRYTDGHTGERRCATVPINTFLTRFLAHTLPTGFTKVRWFGLLSPACRPRLERARELLDVHARACATSPPARTLENANHPSAAPRSVVPVGLSCPFCECGTLRVRVVSARPRAPP